jgi:hypothetical protein
VRVSVNGAVAAESGEAPGEAWHEWVLPVPGRLITAERTRFDLLGRYASFRYWAYQ